MDRRDFSKKIVGSLAAAAVAPAIFSQKNCPKMHKPARLKVGSRVAIIAPASSVSEEKLQKTMSNLTALGLNLRPSDHLRSKNGYLAGSDEERLEDLHCAFADPEIDAIWCARGGYGCTRLLENVDFSLIKKNPKILIGYSDITALHIALPKKTGLVTFHGPVGASDFTDFTLNGIRRALFEPTPRFQISLPDATMPMPDGTFLPEILQKGIGRGQLIGGNLSLLSALAGTKWAPDFSKKIVFIEEIDEKPYRCDRMLTQCLDALNLRKAAGVAIGVFKGCEKPENDDSFTLREMLRDRLAKLGIPVIYGLPFGHISDQCTLPVGIEAELDANRGILTILESGVF
jgi:muramoyltetrapeptide carboxypeptidase